MNELGASLEKILIREATSGEIGAIAEIERASFSDPWSEAAFESMRRAKRSVVTVALRGTAVAGYAVARFVEDEGELANIAVNSTEQKQGVGMALLADIINRARHAGVRSLFLEVRASNAAAQALYAKAGFSQVGRRARYYTHPVEDALILMAALDG